MDAIPESEEGEKENPKETGRPMLGNGQPKSDEKESDAKKPKGDMESNMNVRAAIIHIMGDMV